MSYIPCGACVRRGCSTLCPTGTLISARRGKRSVLSHVPQLTQVLSEMGDPVRQLEAAFKELGMKESPTGNMCASVNALLSANVAISPAVVIEEKRQALGSLRVDEKGDAKYFGPMGCSEALLSLDNRDSLPSSRPSDSICPFSAITSAFTIHSESSPRWDAAQAREYLHKHLPLENRGLALCAIFFQNGCWNVSPLMQDEAAELLHDVYSPAPTNPITTQHLAVAYMIFALGALVDVALPPFSDEAKSYFELARAAMSVKSLFDNPGVLSVQALTMIAAYYGHGGPQFSMDAAWSMISLALNILQTLGLHRVSTYSDTRLSLVDVHRRQALFWEVYGLATLFGQSLGRPTGLFVASVSCPFPPDDEHAEPPFVRIQSGFRSSLWRLTRDVITHTHEAFLTADRPSYDAILDLDERIRRYRLWVPVFDDPEYPIPNPDAPPEDSDPHAVSAYLQRMSRPLVCKMLTMLIHKSSFVEALRESMSLIQSSYAASFLAAYRAASEIIKCQTRNMEVAPILFLRWWPLWKSVFNAAIIVGAVATRLSSDNIGRVALVELFTAVDLFEQVAKMTERAQVALEILRRLRDKAITSYSQGSTGSSSSQLPWPTGSRGFCDVNEGTLPI